MFKLGRSEVVEVATSFTVIVNFWQQIFNKHNSKMNTRMQEQIAE
jgi:hypothetical protein